MCVCVFGRSFKPPNAARGLTTSSIECSTRPTYNVLPPLHDLTRYLLALALCDNALALSFLDASCARHELLTRNLLVCSSKKCCLHIPAPFCIAAAFQSSSSSSFFSRVARVFPLALYLVGHLVQTSGVFQGSVCFSFQPLWKSLNLLKALLLCSLRRKQSRTLCVRETWRMS